MAVYMGVKVCTECHREVHEETYDEARMTALGIMCARCYQSRRLGWIPKSSKLFRVPCAESPGERWRRWVPGKGW